jgi:hypothetical protein
MTAVATKFLDEFKRLAPDEQVFVRDEVISLTEARQQEALKRLRGSSKGKGLLAKLLAERAKGGKGKAGSEPKPAAGEAKAAEGATTGAPAVAVAATAKAGLAASDMREVVLKVVDGKTLLVPVKTGISDETHVVILDGVAIGDTVVTGPYRAAKKLKDGDAVKEASAKTTGKGEEQSGDTDAI